MPAWSVDLLCAIARPVPTIVLVAVFVTVFALTASGYGLANSREYMLKAAYLYKFATYIEWPDTTFPKGDSPFVIGILGPDPVGSDLRKIAEVKKIGNRKIEIRNFKEAEEVGHCHILFMSRKVTADTQEAVIKALAKRNILFVGEIPDFLDRKGVINFEIRDNHIHISVSKSAYEREKLKISAKLLRIMTVK